MFFYNVKKKTSLFYFISHFIFLFNGKAEFSVANKSVFKSICRFGAQETIILIITS